jgi:hypothetical protein
MTELSKLEQKLAEIDREIKRTASYLPLWNSERPWSGIGVVSLSPRLCVMKSDCLKYIAAAKVNQLLEQRQ